MTLGPCFGGSDWICQVGHRAVWLSTSMPMSPTWRTLGVRVKVKVSLAQNRRLSWTSGSGRQDQVWAPPQDMWLSHHCALGNLDLRPPSPDAPVLTQNGHSVKSQRRSWLLRGVEGTEALCHVSHGPTLIQRLSSLQRSPCPRKDRLSGRLPGGRKCQAGQGGELAPRD